MDEAVYRLRMADREEEFADRMKLLDEASVSYDLADADMDRRGPGFRQFVDLIQKVDLNEIKQLVRKVNDQGYVIVENVLTDEQIKRLRSGMSDFFDASARLYGNAQLGEPTNRSRFQGKQTIHVQNVLAKTNVADEVAAMPFFRALLSGILGHDFILNAGAVAMSPDPGCTPQGLHQDDGFFVLMPRPRMPLVVTAAFALDDFTKDNGGTQIVPGSCRWGSDRQPLPEEVIFAEMPAGSMLLWEGGIFHGGGGNSTQDTRRTLTLNYTRGWLRTQFNQYLSVPRERVLAMCPELQSDMGYHRSATGLGGCDTKDPLKYLVSLQDAGSDGMQHLIGPESEV